MRMKKYSLCSLCLCLLLWAGQTSAESLRICTMDGDAPFSERLPSGVWQGFVIELWQALNIEQPYEFVSVDLPSALAGLQDGFCHAIASNITITPPRQQQYLFSAPFMHAGLGVLMRADSVHIRNSDDLTNKTIATIKGSSSEQYIMDNIKNCTLLVLRTQEDIIKALAQKHADIIIFDSPTLHRIANNNKNFVLLHEELYPQEYAFALPKKATALCDTINTALDRLQKDGTVTTLVNKWFDAQK